MKQRTCIMHMVVLVLTLTVVMLAAPSFAATAPASTAPAQAAVATVAPAATVTGSAAGQPVELSRQEMANIKGESISPAQLRNAINRLGGGGVHGFLATYSFCKSHWSQIRSALGLAGDVAGIVSLILALC